MILFQIRALFDWPLWQIDRLVCLVDGHVENDENVAVEQPADDDSDEFPPPGPLAMVAIYCARCQITLKRQPLYLCSIETQNAVMELYWSIVRSPSPVEASGDGCGASPGLSGTRRDNR